MRQTSYALRGTANFPEVTISEIVMGRGGTVQDALQSLHDRMAVRLMEINLELLRLRGERL